MNSTWYDGLVRKRKERQAKKAATDSQTLPPCSPGLNSPQGRGIFSKSASAPGLDEFVERQQKHKGYNQRFAVAQMQKEIFKETRDFDDIEFWGAKGVEGFRTYLKKKFGSTIAAWRVLDEDGNSRLSFYEFCNACRRMGYHGNFKLLWRQLDVNQNGFVSLMELDPVAGQALGTFKLHLLKKYGDMLTAWRKGLDTNGTGRIEEEEVKACLDRLGLAMDSKKLYNMLRGTPNGKGLTLQDFDIDATRRLYTSDESGIMSKANVEFIEDISDGQDMLDSEKQRQHTSGGKTAWKHELEARDKAKWQKEIEDVYEYRAGLHTMDGFKKALIARCGSLVGAWRTALDLDGNERITFGEFCLALGKLGFHGNVKGLWQELDSDKKGYVLFGDFDKDTDAAWSELKQRLREAHGNILLAWVKELDTGGTGCVNENQFVRGCEKVGFSGDARKLFKGLQPDVNRRFLTLRDFDTHAYLALGRGDFRMLSEDEGPSRRNQKLTDMSFLDRQSSGFFHQMRRAWEASRREEFKKACLLANIPEHLVDTVEEFEDLCKRMYGSTVSAWRQCLDLDGNGKLTFNEFCTACRHLGYAGDLKKLWAYYDCAGKGCINLSDIDKEAHEMISSFTELLAERFGHLDNAWMKGFRKDPNDSIDEKELVEFCKNVGYPHDAHKLFKALQPMRGRLLLTIWDIDPECSRKRKRGDTAVLSQPKSPTFHAGKSGVDLNPTISSPSSTQLAVRNPLPSIQRAMRNTHGTTVAAWRAVLDPFLRGTAMFEDFCRMLQECSHQGNAKLVWKEIAGDSEKITLKDIDPAAHAQLDEARLKLLETFGSLTKAWYRGLDSAKTGRVTEPAFVQACEAQGAGLIKQPKRLWRLLLCTGRSKVVTLEDLKVLLVTAPPDERNVMWSGSAEGQAGQRKGAATLSNRELVGNLHADLYKGDVMIGSLDALKKQLKVKYGSVFSGWRNLMDMDQNGVVTQLEFTKTCQRLGIKAARQLWADFHSNNNQITLKDLDPETATALEQLEALLVEKYGSVPDGWRRCFELPEPRSIRVQQSKFVERCSFLGFIGDAAKFFVALRPEPGRSYRTYEDLWHHRGPRGISGTTAEHPSGTIGNKKASDAKDASEPSSTITSEPSQQSKRRPQPADERSKLSKAAEVRDGAESNTTNLTDLNESHLVFDKDCNSPHRTITPNRSTVTNTSGRGDEDCWNCTLLHPPLSTGVKTARVTLKLHTRAGGGWGSNGMYLGITPADHDIAGGQAACGASSTFIYRCRDGDKRIGGCWTPFNDRGGYEEGDEITLEYNREGRSLHVYDASGLCGGGPLTDDLPINKVLYFCVDTCSEGQGWSIVNATVDQAAAKEATAGAAAAEKVAAKKAAAAGKSRPIGCAYGGPIRNNQFTESSNYGNDDTFLHLGRARLNCPHGAWAPNPGQKESRQEWLQVDLGEDHFVTGVQTQGSHGWDEMTTEYEVLVQESASDEWCQAISLSSGSETFPGNSDQDSLVENSFQEPLYGRCVRFIVKSWGSFPQPALRVEVLVLSPEPVDESSEVERGAKEEAERKAKEEVVTKDQEEAELKVTAKGNVVKPEILQLAQQGNLMKLKEILQSASVDVDKPTDGSGNTPLQWAIENGHTDCAQLLVEHGADKNEKDSWGYTALHQACDAGRADCVKLLLKNGWDPHVGSKNGTCYDVAGGRGSRGRQQQCIEALNSSDTSFIAQEDEFEEEFEDEFEDEDEELSP